MFRKKKKVEKRTKVGDFVFYLTLIAVGTCLAAAIIGFPVSEVTFTGERFLVFACGGIFGAGIAHYILRAHLSVLIHELKHMVVATLAGNTAKGLRVARKEGHFEYSYTEETKSYNAFIYLAPYYLPLFTFLVLLPGAFFLHSRENELLILVGIAYGIDLVTSIRDIGPYQTDFQELRGGFPVGVLYVLLFQCFFGLTLLTWVCFGLTGLEKVLGSMFSLLSGYVPEGLQASL